MRVSEKVTLIWSVTWEYAPYKQVRPAKKHAILHISAPDPRSLIRFFAAHMKKTGILGNLREWSICVDVQSRNMPK